MNTQRDLFEEWLAHMDDELDVFKANLPSSLASCLNLSVESLDLLEQYYLTQFATTEAATSESAKYVVDGYARYVGETFRILLNSKWNICLVDPSYVYYGLPTIRDNQLCPLALVTTAADRRTGIFWSTIAKRQMIAGA